jgi:hypothetical protein
MKRIAYAQVQLPDGTLLKRQVVEFANGVYLRHFPLTEELAFTEWRNEKYIIKGESRKEKGESPCGT